MSDENKTTDGVMAQMMAIQEKALLALHNSERALSAVNSHEVLCAERYDNIKLRLQSIPLIFSEIGKVKQIVYIGVGIWIGLPVIAGAMYGLWNLMKATGHGQ